MIEQDLRREIDTALLISRSAVLASEEVDFKAALEGVTSLRRTVADSLPYAATSGAVVAQFNEDYARRYKEYVESILGKEGAEKLMKTGKV